MGSAVSRNAPGRRHIVRLSAPGHSVIVAGGLSQTGARRVAEAVNAFLTDVLYAPAPEPTSCPQCATGPVLEAGSPCPVLQPSLPPAGLPRPAARLTPPTPAARAATGANRVAKKSAGARAVEHVF